MSAFMVDKRHIDALVTLAYRGPVDIAPHTWCGSDFWGRHPSQADFDAMGKVLIRANLDGIEYRYPDVIHNPEATPGPIDRYWERPYVYEEGKRLTIVQALKAIDCYEYQCDESPGWRCSRAAILCAHLRTYLIHCLPGYEQAKWEITE